VEPHEVVMEPVSIFDGIMSKVKTMMGISEQTELTVKKPENLVKTASFNSTRKATLASLLSSTRKA
jgi:hypothetical protein